MAITLQIARTYAPPTSETPLPVFELSCQLYSTLEERQLISDHYQHWLEGYSERSDGKFHNVQDLLDDPYVFKHPNVYAVHAREADVIVACEDLAEYIHAAVTYESFEERSFSLGPEDVE